MSELNQNILFQYFLGAATPLQRKLVEEWLQEGEHLESFYQALEKWEKEEVQFIPDLESALSRVRHSIAGATSPVEVPPKRSARQIGSVFFRRVWWVAASLLLVFGLAGYLFFEKFNYKLY